MRIVKLAVTAIVMAAFLPGAPKAIAADGFDLVVLGALGGIQDGNLSASLIHPHGDNRGVTCDAGTLVNGLRVAEEKGAFANVAVPADAPQLKKYAIAELTPGATTPIADTAMTVTAFPLAHGGVESTAFLLESGGDGILCFGDTGPDAVEKGTRLADVWAAVAERVKQKRLKAIVIEVSYTSDRPDNLLFGHLTPRWLMEEL